MRVVLDTNIWISGLLLPKSTAGKVLQAWQEAAFTVVLSVPLKAEIQRVLNYPKIKKRLGWDEAEIERYISMLSFFCDHVSITQVEASVASDPDDNEILATLIASKADYLVTGDSDFEPYKATHPIISLANFYQNLSF